MRPNKHKMELAGQLHINLIAAACNDLQLSKTSVTLGLHTNTIRHCAKFGLLDRWYVLISPLLKGF